MFLYTLAASTVLGYRALADEPEHIPYLDDKQPRVVFKSGTPQADEPDVIHRGIAIRGKQARSTYIYADEPEINRIAPHSIPDGVPKQARSTYIYDGEPEFKQPRFVFIDKQPRFVFIDKQPRLTIGDTTQAEDSPDAVIKQPRFRFVPESFLPVGSPDDESYPVYRRLLGSPSESYDEADDGIFDALETNDDGIFDDDSERRRQGQGDWLMKNPRSIDANDVVYGNKDARSIRPWPIELDYGQGFTDDGVRIPYLKDARSVDVNDVVYGNDGAVKDARSVDANDVVYGNKDARSVDAEGYAGGYLWDPLATGKDARSVDAQRLARAKGGAKDARSAPATGRAPSKDARTIYVDVTGDTNAQRLARGMNDFQRGREARTITTRSRCPCTIDRRLDEDADHLTAPTTHPDY